MRKILPFEKAVYLTKIDRKVEGDTITQQNQVMETKTTARKFRHAGSASNGGYFFYNSKCKSSCDQQFRTGSTNKDCNPRVYASNNKKINYKKYSKCTISRKTSSLQSSLGKIAQDLEILSIVKGYKIPFVRLPFQEKISNLTKMPK